MERGCTERRLKPPTHLTEPQGMFRKCTQACSLQQYAEIPKQKHAGGYTSMNVIHPTHLTEPQGIIKKPQGKLKI